MPMSRRRLDSGYFSSDDKEIGVAEINKLLQGKIPRTTIKQALSRLVLLKLLERIGQARSTRYQRQPNK